MPLAQRNTFSVRCFCYPFAAQTIVRQARHGPNLVLILKRLSLCYKSLEEIIPFVHPIFRKIQVLNFAYPNRIVIIVSKALAQSCCGGLYGDACIFMGV